ncbi:MAG: sigma-70 family RNA polymerase sigma factor [Muribaculaceae bacterium]|nr:sigma-70 family RNA polymerase sigma factor [Muribaculaceae bacterium]
MKFNNRHNTDTDLQLRREFEQVIDRYDRVIRKVCYFYATDMATFDDLRQEALVNIWRGFPKFRGEASLSTWIYRVTLNSCVSTFRRSRRQGDTVSIDRCASLIAEDDEKAEMLREMYRMINRLGASDKALILLWLDEHSYDEIAAIMGEPRNTIASRLRRAKEKLLNIKPEI